jgi:hypothetical protein
MRFTEVFDNFTDGDVEQRRTSGRGASLKDKGYPLSRCTIFRAMLPGQPLRQMDYVTRSEKFAREHADHMAAVEGETYIVNRYRASTEHVFEAFNPGEYFYDGPAIEGQTIYKADY